MSSSLQQLLDYDGDVEGDFCLAFQATYTDAQKQPVSIDLTPNGNQTPVTEKNRQGGLFGIESVGRKFFFSLR